PVTPDRYEIVDEADVIGLRSGAGIVAAVGPLGRRQARVVVLHCAEEDGRIAHLDLGSMSSAILRIALPEIAREHASPSQGPGVSGFRTAETPIVGDESAAIDPEAGVAVPVDRHVIDDLQTVHQPEAVLD